MSMEPKGEGRLELVELEAGREWEPGQGGEIGTGWQGVWGPAGGKFGTGWVGRLGFGAGGE